MEELNVIDNADEYDIIMITELLPKNRTGISLQSVEYHIEGYTLYTEDVGTNKGRGVGIYVKNSLKCAHTVCRNQNGVESVNLLMKLRDADWLLIQCIYRSPSSGIDSLTEISDLLKLEISNNHVSHRIIAGDINIKDINWRLGMSTMGENHISSRFMEIVRDNYLHLHVLLHTREREGTAPSTLDLVFSNEENIIKNLDYQPPLGNSDHCVLTFNIATYIEQDSTPREKFLYFKGNYDEIKRELTKISWKDELSTLSSIDAWDAFAETIIKESKKHIPVRKTCPTSYKTLWMNDESLAAVRRKRTKWKKYIYNMNDRTRDSYREAKQAAKRECRAAKRNYEKEIAANIKQDPRSFWRYVKSKTKAKDRIEALQDQTEILQHTNIGKAKALNEFFTSVFTKEGDSDIPLLDEKVPDFNLENVVIKSDDIKKHLQELNVTKSAGPDNMHPKLPKELADTIAEPLEIIFNKSIEEGTIPEIWKEANITAIFKKGDKSKPENYRPISLTSILIKVLEKEIRKAIVAHMDRNNFFSKFQHGFRSGFSCVTQLLKAIDDWTKFLDNRKQVDVIYFDFKKAFDTVPHKRLVGKLHSYGIRGNILNWLENFLHKRKQRVMLDGQTSEWTDVTSGIPQGSVLGPILFLIYINDLPDIVQSFIKLFADDTKIYKPCDNELSSITLQNDIDRMTDWSKTWLLKFNEQKCKHLQLGQQQLNTEFKMKTDTNNEIVIESTSSEKDLGIIIDNRLNFQEHIYTQISKANKILGLIRRTFQYLDKEMLVNLYKSLIRPHLEYGSNVWSVIWKKEATAIENVQRRATKLVKTIAHLTYQQRLKVLGLPSLEYRRLRNDMVETYKILTGVDKADKHQLFELENQGRTRGHPLKIRKKHCRINVRKFSFGLRVVSPWNHLPEEIVLSANVNTFKSRLNKHWKDHPIKFTPSCYTPGAGSDANYIDTSHRGVTAQRDFDIR